MKTEIEWSRHASERLEALGLQSYEYEVERKLQDRSRWRRNPGRADWRSAVELREYPRPLLVLFDNPVSDDDLMAELVTVWRLPKRNKRRRSGV